MTFGGCPAALAFARIDRSRVKEDKVRHR